MTCTFFRHEARRWSQVVSALAALTAATYPVHADVVSVEDMVRGTSSSSTQCSIKPEAVWVTVKGRGFCMRYYLAPGPSEGKPVVFLQGDRLGVLNLRTGVFAVPPGEKDINTDDLTKIAVILARQTKLPSIYLARVGVEGSSGDHRLRHSVLELDVTNAALDAIKQKHHFEGFHLLGQSGGAHLVSGLLARRDDIDCAIIGSGPLTPVKRPKPDDPALEHFNPLAEIATVARNRSARIMVITDPEDKKVSGQTQTNFVRMLRQAGRPVDQFIVQAVDENRHGVVAYSRIALSGCLRKAGTEEIAKEVDRVVQLRVAASKPKPVGRNDASNDGSVTSGQTQTRGSGTEPAPRPREPGTVLRSREPETTHMEKPTD